MTLLRSWFFPHFIQPSFWRLMHFCSPETSLESVIWPLLRIMVVSLVIPVLVGATGVWAIGTMEVRGVVVVFLGFSGILSIDWKGWMWDIEGVSVMWVGLGAMLVSMPWLLVRALWSSWQPVGVAAGVLLLGSLWAGVSGLALHARLQMLKKEGKFEFWCSKEEAHVLRRSLPKGRASSSKRI